MPYTITSNSGSILSETAGLFISTISVSSPANSAIDTIIGTIVDGDIVIRSLVVRAVAPQTPDLISIAVKGGTNKIVTFIPAADAWAVDFAVTDRQVSWDNRGNPVVLPEGRTIVMEHNGGGAGALDLEVTIVYSPVNANARIV